MKSRALGILLTLVFMLCLSTGAWCADDQKTWNLRFTGPDVETHPSVANGFLPWFKDVEKATNGRVKIRYFNPNTIAPVNEIVTSIESGAIDMGTIDHARNAGRFPLHDVFVLPMLTGNSTAQGVAAWKVYQDTPALQKEMDSMKVLGYFGGGSMQVMTKNKPVEKLEDMKGLRMATLSKPFADAAQALGANPITIPVTDFYTSLSRNTVDSALFSNLAAGSIKIQDLIKNVTIADLMKDVRFIAMNKEVWDSFPPDIQEAIESTCVDGALALRISQAMDNADAAGRELLKNAGAQYIELSPEERVRWIKAVEPIDNAWVEKVVQGGVDRAEAEALLKKARTVGAEVTAELSGK